MTPPPPHSQSVSQLTEEGRLVETRLASLEVSLGSRQLCLIQISLRHAIRQKQDYGIWNKLLFWKRLTEVFLKIESVKLKEYQNGPHDILNFVIFSQHCVSKHSMLENIRMVKYTNVFKTVSNWMVYYEGNVFNKMTVFRYVVICILVEITDFSRWRLYTSLNSRTSFYETTRSSITKDSHHLAGHRENVRYHLFLVC
jgi:hypothetical protein